MEKQRKSQRTKAKVVAWLTVPVVGLIGMGGLLNWMGSNNIAFRPGAKWMSPPQELVVSTPTHPTRITMEKSSGIFIYKRPIPIIGVRHKSTATVYVAAPQPELPNGYTVEFPNNLRG